MDSIDAKVDRVSAGFQSGKTRPYAYRKAQLQALHAAVRKHYDDIVAALGSDLSRSSLMSKLTAAEHLLDLIAYTLENLKVWMRDDPREMPALLLPGSAYVRYDPLGVVLIMGSWNFPFSVTVGPLVSAIAAGNAAIIKPSEISVASSKVIESLVSALDPECYQTVQGGPEVAANLTSRKWDLVFFTGSTEKGRLVAQAAAATLTPCLLELGGKNPAIVDADADLNSAALRIAQGRTLNLGQVCLSPEYVFVHESVAKFFEDQLLSALKRFYGDDPHASADYSRIITTGSTQRIAKLLEDHGGEVLCGGTAIVEERYVAPTVIRNPKLESKLMNEEVFGPVLAVFTFKRIEECVEFVNKREKPLVVYYFGSANKDLVATRTRSGGFVQNECLFHYSVADLPFGGVGASGVGRYHGEEGFRQMSNVRSMLEKDTYNGFPVSLRFPPHNEAIEKTFLRIKSMSNFSTADMRSAFWRCAALSAVGWAVYKGYLGRHTLDQVRSVAVKAVDAVGLKRWLGKE